MKSDALIDRNTAKGLGFDDGSELEADVIVFCTGFETSYKRMIGEMFGEQISKIVTEFVGLDEEGEARGSGRLTGRE